jgi:hypothetical protein
MAQQCFQAHNNGEVHKSKSVDHGNSMLMRSDSTVTQNSASVDDDVIMMCSNDMQQSTTPMRRRMEKDEWK